jgi:hypothetical protein
MKLNSYSKAYPSNGITQPERADMYGASMFRLLGLGSAIVWMQGFDTL